MSVQMERTSPGFSEYQGGDSGHDSGYDLEHFSGALEGSRLEVCSVRVEQTLFGIPIPYILEIVAGTHTQAVPLAPEFVGGLFHYRGDVLTTVSLRNLLGLPPSEGRQDILVLESGNGTFGLLVDSVGEVFPVSSVYQEPNPSTLDERRGALFDGAYKLKDGLLVMLDPGRLDPDRLSPARSDAVAG